MAAIDTLFDDVVKRGASDLHLAVNQPPLARIRGEVVPLREAPISAQELEAMLLELVTPAQHQRLAADLELDLAVSFRDVARFRAKYYVKHAGIAAAFRLVPLRVPSLESVTAPDVVRRFLDRRSGLLLVAGPASSGKTTTLAAMVDAINRTRYCHVVTLEAPIEFVHEPQRAQVAQREIGVHAPSLAAALKNVGRESADVIVISELAAAEDIESAARLAVDGALVLATYQASSAASALDRLMSAAPAPDQVRVRGLVADALAGVVVQHLVRTADGGRVPVHEVLVGTPTIASLLRQGKTDGVNEAMMAGVSVGMMTLDDGLERLLGEGKISAEEAIDRCVDKVAFARAVARPRPEHASSRS